MAHTERAQLPAELIDRVVDFLWDDRATLRNCTLACRATQPRGRFHLFSALRLTTRARLEQVLNVWRTSHLAEFIRALELVETSVRANAWVHLAPHVLGCMLHRIEALAIRGVDWAESPPSFFAVLPVFTRLTRLELSECQFTTQRHLQDFLCRLPCLQDLELGLHVRYGTSMAVMLQEQPVPAVERLALTSLTVGCNTPYDASMLMWFASISPALPLRCISVTAIPRALPLLETVAETLEELRLTLCGDLPPDTPLPLRRCIRLRRLYLRYPSNVVGTLYSGDAQIYGVLAQVPLCSAIELLEIDLYAQSPSVVDWKHMDGILLRENFPNLRKIRLTYTWLKKRGTLGAWKRRTLVAARKRGVDVQHCVSFPVDPLIAAPLRALSAAQVAAFRSN